MANIVMVIAHSMFRDEELFDTKAELERNGHHVTLASSIIGICDGSRGGTAVAEILVEDINLSEVDALVFIGGPGASEYFENKIIHKLAREIVESDKLLAAICIAPVLLAKADLLDGKKATVFSSGAKVIEENGALYTGDAVTVDGKIVTGNGPKSAVAFAKKIAEILDNSK
ncbi:MAG: DJ-1/PfpI family protein [Paludibacter sp.]|nr:DJ-1/PfpI family protein [Paludibacter sp.]